MTDHEKLLDRFYSSLQKKDHAGMIACYHPEIHFTDEVFDLHGKSAGAMWHMLCSRGQDLRVVYRSISADETAGRAEWEADYTFSKSGRRVHNAISAAFEFRDGQMIRHRDTFDFWKWTRMALGVPGVFLGWSSWMRRQVSWSARQSLEAFIAKHPEYR